MESEKVHEKERADKLVETHEKEIMDLKHSYEIQIASVEENCQCLEKALAKQDTLMSEMSAKFELEKAEREKSYEQQLSEAYERARMYEMDVGKVKRQLEEMRKDHQKEREELQKDLETQIFDLENKCSIAISERDRMRQSLWTMEEDFGGEKQSLGLRIQELEELCHSQEKQTSDLQDKLIQSSQQSEENISSLKESFQAEVSHMEEQNQQLTADLEQLQDQLKTADKTYRQELEALKHQHAEEMSIVQEKCRQAEVYSHMLQSHMDSASAPSENPELLFLRAENERLKQQLAVAEAGVQDLQRQLREAHDENENRQNDVFQKSVHEGLVVVQKSESTKDEAIEAEVAKRVKGATEHLEEQWVEKLRSQEIDLQIQYDQQRKEYQQQMEHQCQKQVEAVRHESHVAFVAAVRKMRRKLEGKQKRGKEKHSLGGPRKQTDGAGDQATSRISEADDENLGERVEQLNKENQELAEVRDVLLEQIAISQTQGLRHTLRHELQQAFVTGRGKISPSQSLKSVTAAAEDPVAAEKMSVSPASQAEARQLIVADSQHSVFSMSSGSGASHSSEDTVQAGAVLKMEMEEEDEASLCEDGLETSSARERFLEELEEMSQQSSQDLPLEWELTSTTVSHSSASAGGFEHDQLGTGSVWEVFDGRCMRQDCREVQCESVDESNSMMQEKCTALEEVIKTLQENEQLLQAERKRFKGSEQSLQDECKTLKEHEQSLQEELAVVKAHEQELREECRILKERERSLQDECESLKKNELSLQEECRVLKEEEQTLQEECSSLKETKRILQEECRVLKEKEESLEEEFRILEESYNVLQKSHDTLQEKAESLDRARSSLLEACKPAESKRSVLRSEDTTTEEGSEASALEESSLSVGDDASETVIQEEKYEELLENNRKLTVKICKLEERKRALIERCEALEECYRSQQKKNEKLKEECRVFQIKSSSDLNEDLGNQVAELEQILTEKEDLIAELKERMVLLMKQQEELLPLVGLGGDADTPGKKVVTLKEQMVEKENKIQELQETFDLLLQNHADLRKKVKEDKKLEQQIKVRERALSEKERVITELREECRRLQQNLFAEKHKNGDLNSSVDSSQACGIDRQEQIIPEEETKRAQVRLTDLLPKPGEATSERSFESDSIAISSDPDSDITPGVDVDIVREMGRLRKDIKKTKAVYANESALLQEALDREKLSQSRVRSSKSPSLSRDFTEMTPSDIPDDPEALKKMVVKLLEENKQLTTENLRLQLRIREQEALVVEMEEKLKKVLKSPDDWQSMFERQLLLLQKQRDELLQQIHERDASIGLFVTETWRRGQKRHLEQLLLLKDEMERQLMRQKRLLEEELASIEGKLQEREATLVEEKARLLTELKEKDMRIFQLQTSQLNSPQMQSSVTSVKAVELLRSKLQLEMEIAQLSENQASAVTSYWQRHNKQVP
nr:hypothetical protein BaRGS_025726 [Batillaria attramentaria]